MSTKSKIKTMVPAAFVSNVEPLLIPVSEAARLLSISEWSVRRLVRKGYLSVRKLSCTHWLIQTESLRRFASGSERRAA